MTETAAPASAAQIDYATRLRNNLRDRVAADASTDPDFASWTGEIQRRTDETVKRIYRAAVIRSAQRGMPAWQLALMPTTVIRGADDPDGCAAQMADIAAAVSAQRAAINDAADEQIAAMTTTEISAFIDAAKSV